MVHRHVSFIVCEKMSTFGESRAIFLNANDTEQQIHLLLFIARKYAIICVKRRPVHQRENTNICAYTCIRFNYDFCILINIQYTQGTAFQRTEENRSAFYTVCNHGFRVIGDDKNFTVSLLRTVQNVMCDISGSVTFENNCSLYTRD